MNLSKYRRDLIDGIGYAHDYQPSLADYLHIEMQVRQIVPDATEDQVQALMDLIGDIRPKEVLDPYLQA